MLYLIGGSARVGKSTIARTLRSQLIGSQSLSGDSLRQVLKPHIPKNLHGGFDLRDPAEYISYYTHHASQEIANLEQQADAIAPYLSTYIDSIHLESSDDLIVESVDIWPNFIRQIKQPYKVVFLLDTSKSQWQRIKQSDDEYSWLLGRKLTNEQLKAWAIFGVARSKHIKKQCITKNLPYIDLAESSFHEAQAKGISLLLGRDL